MNKFTAALALAMLVLISCATVADAKGGRTTSSDCKAGSSDPDCPDEPDPPSTPTQPPKPPASL